MMVFDNSRINEILSKIFFPAELEQDEHYMPDTADNLSSPSNFSITISSNELFSHEYIT